ncbi:uncharacterized protein V3H82_003139 [Fundulus diaphanus]
MTEWQMGETEDSSGVRAAPMVGVEVSGELELQRRSSKVLSPACVMEQADGGVRGWGEKDWGAYCTPREPPPPLTPIDTLIPREPNRRGGPRQSHRHSPGARDRGAQAAELVALTEACKLAKWKTILCLGPSVPPLRPSVDLVSGRIKEDRPSGYPAAQRPRAHRLPPQPDLPLRICFRQTPPSGTHGRAGGSASRKRRNHFLLSINNLPPQSCFRLNLESSSRTLQYTLAKKMDSSSDAEWRAGVEKSISMLESGVAEILGHLRGQEAPASALPQTPSPDTASRTVTLPEPRLTPPQPFGGDPEQCRAFLTQCEIHFELQPSSYPTDRSRIAYVISLLTGKARLWGAAEWQNDSRISDSYYEFSRELVRVFSPVLPCRESSRGLLSLKQGERTVSDYIIDFHLLAADSLWNEPALMDVFIEGLNGKIKDELATRDYPQTLKQLEDLVTRIDLRLMERRRERRPIPPPRSWVSSFSPAGPSASRSPADPEPMQLGKTVLSKEERQHRQQQDLCLYCGGEGHRVRSCPVKGQAH